jgi:hypothetical protein
MQKRLPAVVLFLFCLIALSWAGSERAGALELTQQQGQSTRSQDLTFQGLNFADDGGGGENIITGGSGVTLAPGADAATYTSPPLDAPLAFNALVPQWRTPQSKTVLKEGQAGLVPDHEHDHELLHFQFRTAKGGRWSDWLDIYENHDLLQAGDTFYIGDMLVVPAADVTHDRFQYRVHLQRSAGQPTPRLEELRITFIDATAGPTTEELVAQQEALPEPQQPSGGYPKPPVIPRSEWCTDPACNYSDGLQYHPVTHLILHHTVTTSSGDSAATVRAIWRFHTFSRGWGDIGYNYLVDTNGVLFEGHLGGDDVVGTHSGDANAGSMALSLIGNFVDVTPPQAMMESAADLFAWKADQKNIDIFDAGMLPHMDWGLVKLIGHRDIYGTTQCPGDRAHALLPALRDAIAQRINFTPPHLYYDELDPQSGFSRSPVGWERGPAGCGWGVNSFYAWTTTDSGTAPYWADWRPQVSVPGQYELWVFAPYCRTGARDTNGARYRISDPNGTSVVTINQEAALGLWRYVGNYTFSGNSTSIHVDNITSTDSDFGLWADAIRLRYLDPGALNRSPLDESWHTSRTVNFQWTVTNQGSASNQRLQVALDDGFTNLVVNQSLGASAGSYTHTFGQDYEALFWRVLVTNTQGQTEVSRPTRFGIDTQPPVSRVHAVFRYPDGRLLVGWQGEDASSGIVRYNIDYRAEGSGTWQRWRENTTLNGDFFAPPDPGQTYWFRSQAIDASNQVEPLHSGSGDSNTQQSILLNRELPLPLLLNQ